jgi:hypothetical protein
MELLMTYLFWVEKTVEIQILRNELSAYCQGRIEGFIFRGVFHALMSSLQWIEELGTTVSITYSIFQNKVIDEEVTAERAIT